MVQPIPWLCWSLPIAGALLTPLFAKIHPKVRDYGAVFFSFLGAVMAALLIRNLVVGWYYEDVLMTWVAIPGRPITVGMLVDPLSIVLANVVAFISFLIMVYSLGYMHDDPCLTRYWFFMNFFIGNMLLLVLSNNLILTMIGWEGVGLCSYMLIGFWYRDPEKRWLGGPKPKAPMFPPSECGMKAFVVTGIGDVFLLAAIFILYIYAGTVNYVQLFETAPQWLPQMAMSPGLLALTAIFLLGGPIGKSAQFPLHEWLPEAMAGPTSVSALIHAATMVKAGVYLVGRMLPLFYLGYWLLHLPEAITFFVVAASIGAFTAFLAGTQAMVSLEIKKVLAYSTVSQIGYMMLGLGCAGLSAEALMTGYVAGIFHLVSHALFKATLFLSAGAVLHTAESIYMSDMGGLQKIMPYTYAFMAIAGLSLSGIPPLSGFWSKDAVLIASLEAGQWALFALGAITAAITIFYTVRFLAMTFWWTKSKHLLEREYVLERTGRHLHEAPKVMWVPYGILTVLIVMVGFVGLFGVAGFVGPEQFLHSRFEWVVHEYIYTLPWIGRSAPTVHEVVHEAVIPAHEIGLVTSLGMLVIGGVVSYKIYVRREPDPRDLIKEHRGLRGLWTFLWNRWYMNPAYYKVFVHGLLRVKQVIFEKLEQGVIDKISDGVAGAVMGIQRVLFEGLEQGVIDKISDGVAGAAVVISRWSERVLESSGIDAGFNVGIPRVAEALYHRIKRIQTGVLSYNMLYVVLTLLVILIVFLVVGV